MPHNGKAVGSNPAPFILGKVKVNKVPEMIPGQARTFREEESKKWSREIRLFDCAAV